MSSVVFDIETLALPFESFDASQQTYLMKHADTDEKRDAELLKLNLTPLTAQIIAIAMLNPDTMGGKVFFQSDIKENYFSESGSVEFISGSEKEVLANFWTTIEHYERFITFNGRGFDNPFIMLRSAILGVRPTRNLMPYRYDSARHCDLLEQMTFYGVTRKFNLDFYCKALGIKSPKSEGISGLDLGPMYYDRKFRQIAEYCLGDVIATAELFRRWDNFLNIR